MTHKQREYLKRREVKENMKPFEKGFWWGFSISFALMITACYLASLL